MTDHLIWALVATVWALAAWDMVRRWAFATATSTLKADLDGLCAELGEARLELRAEIAEIGNAKLPERVKKLETLVIALKTHAETQATTPRNPFLRGVGR